MKMLSNTPPQKISSELWKHFSDTYFSLRVGLALLTFAMPLMLYLCGKLFYGLDLQASMSAYFWAAGSGQCATFPMRTIFVGLLCAIGAGLYAYKGLTPRENTLLNVAAVCAMLVAIFPERPSLAEAVIDPRMARLFEICPAVQEWAKNPPPPIHYIAAVLLFLLLAVVAWSCADKSLEYLPAGRDPERFKRCYKAIAIAMGVFPFLGFALAFLLHAWSDRTFFIEAAGVWTFGTYWILKTYELSLSRLESDPVAALGHAEMRRAMKENAAKDK